MKSTLFNSCLYLIADQSRLSGCSLESVIEKAVRGGVNLVQLRAKGCSTREFLALSLRVKMLLCRFEVPLIINDRIDIALAVQADGVHVGQSDMPYSKARELMGPEAVIGISVESVEQAIEANEFNCDYLGVSSIFPSQTKLDTNSFWGLDGLTELRKISRHKLIAIGGVNASNISQVIDLGADGVAVSSYICTAKDPTKAAKELANKLKKGE